MRTVPATKELRPLPTLLGGSGRARPQPAQHRSVLASLLRPLFEFRAARRG